MPVLESEQVISADGTRIGIRTLGAGPLLVLAHDAFTTSDDYVPVAVRLASRYQVVLADRRGYRGGDPGSGPATFDQDGEDLLAILERFGSHGMVFGHGVGALAAMHAAQAGPDRVTALVLYEPPVLFTGPARRPLLERYRQLRAAGDDGGALVAFASATAAVPEDAVRRWIDSPALDPRLTGAAVGVGRDLEAIVACCPDFERWRQLAIPVTLLVGGESRQEPLAASVRGLAGVLPRARTRVLGGQEHVAHLLDPALLADCLRAALAE